MDQETILRKAAEAAQQMSGGAQPPPGIAPQPVPMTFRIGQANGPGGESMVVLMVSTPVGESIYFLDSKMAQHVSDGLKQAATAAASGLVLP